MYKSTHRICIPTFLLCRQFTTFIGTGAIFALSVLYGMQVVGKK